MLLGLLLAGMCLGAFAAGTWIATGGSVLVALALYAIVGTGSMLLAAVAVHLLSGFRMTDETAAPEPLHAAE
jgi:hypothetical protein